MKTKILVVGPSPSLSKGGMATVIRDIHNDPLLNSNADIDIYESYIDGSFIKRLLFSVTAFIRFCLSKKDYDLYHIHAASYGSTFRKGFYLGMAKKWGKPVILHIHGAAYMKFYNQLSPKNKQRVIDILKSADVVVALSDEWKKVFEETFGLKNCVSLPNGINTEQYIDAQCDAAEHIDEFVVLGKLGQRKGTYDLIDAVEKSVNINNGIKVYIAGDGEIEKAKSLVKEKNLDNNIDIVGWVDFDGKIDLLKKSATLVLPSYNEGLPMSILEGMASGKAIVSSTVGAIPEVIKEENGILINPGDVEALSDALIKCSQNVEMVRNMGNNNINKINEAFSMDIMHQRLLDLYSTVLKTYLGKEQNHK